MGDQDLTEESGSEEQEDQNIQENGFHTFSQLSASVQAVVRIRQKYQALKKRRLEMAGSQPTFSSPRTSPKIFTFDAQSVNSPPPVVARKKKRRKRGRVLYPSARYRKVVPKHEHSRAKNCLFLLCFILFLQVYNAIENLDDHVLRYDLEGLEKVLKREVFGQQEVRDNLMEHLKDYLSTYVHSKPLVLSLHGPTGVGKSHLGRLLAQHFRYMVGERLVLQYFALHHCPSADEVASCAQSLATLVSDMVTQAEDEEKIPVFIFDEVEHMPRPLLDKLHELIRARHMNEYLNAMYILISSHGHEEIAKFVLHNSSSSLAGDGRGGRVSRELAPLLRQGLVKRHLLWKDAEILPLTLLEKSHVVQCFVDEMSREGFYPDLTHIEQLAGEISYYSVGGREFSRTGCKQVVAKVNLL
ncbi:torsin-4A [Sardina pilchardus]|uniref:torsin-4A n=1 Tax=Sardina pilchardus TaxID=27697 RepID=UPI002E0D991B